MTSGALGSRAGVRADLDAPRGHRNPADGLWHVPITQGGSHVSNDPEEVVTTVLGSCIAACLRDPVAGIGGMNHFLLPEGGGSDRLEMRYGANAMELLINEILRRGGSRNHLEAKVFGGASVVAGLSDVGARNVAFIRKYLADEGIPVVRSDVGGDHARRVQFEPVSGRARVMKIADFQDVVFESEIATEREDTRTESKRGNDVELF